MSRKRTTFGAIAAGLIMTMALALPSGTAAADPGQQQFRGYWVDSFNAGIYNPAQVTQLVADAKRVKANALVVQVGRETDCFCNDSAFPRTQAAGVDPAPYDPLAEVIEQAHAAGLEVHAWVNSTILWRSLTPPTDPEHAYHEHGVTATGRDRWINRRVDGEEVMASRVFLDPANPDAVDYMVNGITSIARNYDIDGVNLDYIRYPDYSSVTTTSEWGYSETSIARFQAATGRTDVPAPADAQFSDWRRAQVTSYVRKIYLGLYAVKPSVRLSMDGITYGYGPQGTTGGYQATRTYAEVMQDWKGWLAEGIMDTNIAMNYKRDSRADQSVMFDQWSEFLADNQGRRSAVNGPALYLNTIEESLAQARDALAPTAAGNRVIGWSGYSYANASALAVTDPTQAAAQRDALADALAADLFAEEAAVPDMPWKSRPTRGHLQGKLEIRGGGVLDQAEVTLTSLSTGEKLVRRSDGSGWFGFVDVKPGRYLAQVKLPSGVLGKPVTSVEVRTGKLGEVRLGPFRTVR